MPQGPPLFARLRHRDRAVREEARREVAARVAAHGGDVRAAAAELGISARTVRRWMDAGEGEAPAAIAAPAAMAAPETAAPETAAPEAEAEPAARDAASEAAASGTRTAPPAEGAASGSAVSAVPSPRRAPLSAEASPGQRAAAPAATAAPLGAAAAARVSRAAPRSAPAVAPAPRPAAAGLRGPTPFADFASRFRHPLGHQPAPDDAPEAPAHSPPLAPHAPASVATSHPPASAPALAPPGPQAPGPAPSHPGGGEASALPAGPWPHHQPEAAAPPAEAPVGDGGPRRLAFVLHAHLPWVLGHGTWPHGEDWLAEAVVHCYLPLVSALRRLAAAGGRDLLALSVSPVLAAQLADRRLRPLVEGYLAHRAAAAGALAAEHPLGEWWREAYAGLARDWEEIGGDLLGALRALQGVGAIELSTCAATHGYLPLLHRPEHVALQVRAARHNHERWFGAAPAGLWMPECAYRPPGPWLHPVTGARESFRAGNEGFLAAAGVRWTVVDAHLLLGDEPLLPYPFGGEGSAAAREGAPAGADGEPVPTVASRLQPHQVDATPLAALFREPHTARQVWSRQGGYPGDPRYLDFHKRDATSGLRLWRVTDAAGDLADKLAYHPADAAAAARQHARHFVDMLAAVPGLGGGVAVSPYDAELFGHWWFEGPLWLEETLALCLADPRVAPTTPRRELAASPPRRRAELREGSWGEAGDHRVWANDGTAWMWRELRAAEEGVADALAAGLDGPRARAVLAQLLLLAASDWPFLVTTGTAADYAADRFRTHRARLAELLAPDPGAPLPEWAEQDLAGLDIDPRWWHWEVPG